MVPGAVSLNQIVWSVNCPLGGQEPVSDDSTFSMVICLLVPPGILNTPMTILEWIKPPLKNSNTEILFQ